MGGVRVCRRVSVFLLSIEYRHVHLQHHREVVEAAVLLRDVAEHEGVVEGDPPVELHGGQPRVAPPRAGLVRLAGGDGVVDGGDVHHALEGGRVGQVEDVHAVDADVGGAAGRVVGVHAHPHGQVLGRRVEGDGVVARPPQVLNCEVDARPQEPGGLEVAVCDGYADVVGAETGSEHHHHNGGGECKGYHGCNDANQSQATDSASVRAGGHRQQATSICRLYCCSTDEPASYFLRTSAYISSLYILCSSKID